ncbi:TIM barrel protein [Microbacteriaceae bacterium K1510]|nr:TIM barrel protein [Microbacteriaceae bacterium K1510]
MPRFSAHLGYLFTDRPLLERIDAAAACGFQAIEGRFPDVPAADFKRAATRNNLKVLGINTPQGGPNDFGLGAVPGREQDWQTIFAQALDYVSTVDGLAIHCLAGMVAPEQRRAAEATFVDNLKRAADRAAARNIKLYIEPINPRDMPNYFLSEVEHAADIIAKIGSDNVFIQYDLYHMQIVGGDLIERFKKYQPLIAHVQCSQVPVRHEPDGDGEINYPFVFAEIDRLGYPHWIGAEYRPRKTTESGLAWGAAYGLHAPSG